MAVVEITCWWAIFCGGCGVRLQSQITGGRGGMARREQPLSVICACGHHQLFQEEDWRPEHNAFIPLPMEWA